MEAGLANVDVAAHQGALSEAGLVTEGSVLPERCGTLLKDHCKFQSQSKEEFGLEFARPLLCRSNDNPGSNAQRVRQQRAG